jgi:uncharacterized protein (DUF885 family)
MKKLFIILLVIPIFSCKTNFNKNGMESNVYKLCENYYEERLQFYPIEATMQGDNRFNDKLPNELTDKFHHDVVAFYTKFLKQAKESENSKLSQDDKMNLSLLEDEISINLEALKVFDNYTPINQFGSLPLTFAQMGSGKSFQPFNTVKDYTDFLKRINAFTEWTDTAIVKMKQGMKLGIVQPKVLMMKVLPQLNDMIVIDYTKSIFYIPIENLPKSFSQESRDSIKSLYIEAIQNKIIPSFQKLYTFIKNEYIPACRNTSGLYGTPNGKEKYQFAIKYFTNTDFTPDSIYNIGLSEVKRIRTEMESVKNQLGFKGNLKDFFTYTANDAKFKPFKIAGEVLEHYQEIYKTMQPQLKKEFNVVPKSKFEIRETEKFREASASAEYMPGTADGSRPGIFYVPVPDPKNFNDIGMESIFLHEAIPGHHYQISIQQEKTDLPRFRKFGWNGAFGEGWALYCEGLGKELGLYTDPYQYFGRLTNEMHRAVRLVVDAGMHAKGWTREQALEYTYENESIGEADAVAEIERYMAWPGQALSYKIGEMKILSLRKKAEKELGNKFSISKFHDEVLSDGTLPLDILEKKIDNWINEEKLK